MRAYVTSVINYLACVEEPLVISSSPVLGNTINFTLTPNPTSGNVIINYIASSKVSIVVTDNYGKVIWNKTNIEISASHKLYIKTQLAARVYFITLSKPASISTKQLIRF
jgi:hypothetical protein